MQLSTSRESRAATGLIAVLLLVACHPTRGCIESSFDLPDDNRLPAWFELPAGLKRTDVAVHMDYWGGLSGRTATMKLTLVKGGTLDSVVATMAGNEPIDLPSGEGGGTLRYPSYEVLTARGKTEVIEHRRMEPLFFICDDPDIKRRLGVR